VGPHHPRSSRPAPAIDVERALVPATPRLISARFFFLALLPLLLPAQTPSDAPAILDRARAYALDYSQTLPDFICNEVIRRYREGMKEGAWDLTDTLTVRLSYYGHREDYKLLQVNGKNAPANTRYEYLTGSITEGEFGSLLRQVFEPHPATQIRWSGWENLNGMRVAVFTYRISAERAHYTVSFTLNDIRYSTVAGRRGNLYVVPEDGRILRVTSAADALPADFPVHKLISTLDYKVTPIGDRSFVLPRTADVQMSAGTYQTRNTIEFSAYHKFAADADVTFDPAPSSTSPARKK